MDHYESLEDSSFKKEIIEDLIYLGTFGLDDPIREDVIESIQLIKYGKVQDDNAEK